MDFKNTGGRIVQVSRNQVLLFASLAAALAGGYFAWTRIANRGNPKLRRQIGNRLPVSKNLETISDVRGNYDLDGVSFDTEGVVVSGDANKSLSL